jgi:PRTRC genetic system protein E
MQLITPFVPLLRGGVVLTLRICAAAGQNIQLDLLPQGKDSSTGVALPARALVGTAQELDEHLEAYLQKYASWVTRVADIVAGADAEMQAIEDAASAQARKAVAERSRSKPHARAVSSPHASGPVTGDADGDSDDDAPLLSTACGSPTSGAVDGITPSAGAAPGEGISQQLFIS